MFLNGSLRYLYSLIVFVKFLVLPLGLCPYVSHRASFTANGNTAAINAFLSSLVWLYV